MRELTQLQRLLETTLLLTLVGPGGVGKNPLGPANHVTLVKSAQLNNTTGAPVVALKVAEAVTHAYVQLSDSNGLKGRTPRPSSPTPHGHTALAGGRVDVL